MRSMHAVLTYRSRLMAWKKNGLSTLKTRHITIQRKLSLSVALQLVWAGAIRDPLSGRTYVYQAMRVTGAADPTVSVKDTLKGKLPQKKLVREAAHGYSSYGNQIGLATGLVKEIYHPDYVAKRMEIGAVLGAAPRRAVIRENSVSGEISSFFSEAAQDVTVAAELPGLPKFIQKNL